MLSTFAAGRCACRERDRGRTLVRGKTSVGCCDQEPATPSRVSPVIENKEACMTFGKGALLWLLGIPLPIIILLALFWR